VNHGGFTLQSEQTPTTVSVLERTMNSRPTDIKICGRQEQMGEFNSPAPVFSQLFLIHCEVCHSFN